MKDLELTTLRRSTSSTTTGKFLPSIFHHTRSSSLAFPSSSESTQNDISADKIIVPKRYSSSSLLHSLLAFLPFPSFLINGRKWFSNVLSITPSLGRKLTGTLFGHRHGHVSFAVQVVPLSEPLMLLELDMSTASLVKEMSSGLLRIALECEKVSGSGSGPGPGHGRPTRKLLQEATWTMYCNGRKCGLATSRTWGAYDLHVLNTVRSVSVGAGVIPVVGDGRKSGGPEMGELVYMRAKFERIVGSRDSEALYMINPDGNGGPELCIFLLRI